MEKLLELYKEYADTKQVSEGVYLTLHKAMIQGLLKPLDRLSDDKIAQCFEVSRTPVREAIKKLEYEGFVFYNAKYGFCVKEYNRKECIDLLSALDHIRQITTRMAADTISRADIIRLEMNIDDCRRYIQDGNDEALLKGFEDFHVIVSQSCNNQFLEKYHEELTEKYNFIMNAYAHVVFNKQAVDEHEQIYKALKEHDKDLAWDLIVKHSRSTDVRIKQFFM